MKETERERERETESNVYSLLGLSLLAPVLPIPTPTSPSRSPFFMTWSLLLVLLLFSPPVLAVARPGPQHAPQPSDTDALTIFRSRTDAHGNLATNWSTPDACTGRWRGVGCSGGRVTSLALPFLDLRGPLAPLSQLDQLRRLDLQGNRLNGTLLPLIPALPNLKLLYLSQNDISGEIPPAVGRLTRLLRLDLSSDDLRGTIPGNTLANLTRLLTLRLQNNLFSGRLPDLSAALPYLVEFNASNNKLYGRVPDGMRARFGTASFAGNAGLCGPTPPLPPCLFMPHESPPSSSSSPRSVVPSNPGSRRGASSNAGAVMEGGEGEGGDRNGEGLSRGAIVGIAVGNVVFLLVVLSLLCGYRCFIGHLGHKDGSKIGGEGDYPYTLEAAEEEKKRKKCSRDSDGGESDEATAQQSKLMFFEEEAEDDGTGGKRGRRKGGSKRFELEELLRASAEMLGKGSLGTVYRAVLEDGCMVAVKRLRDANPCARAEFHEYMDLIGRLRRPNLVRLRAYYYAKQEKLLIYDYLPNGSLHSRLHGTSSLHFSVMYHTYCCFIIINH